MRHHAGPDEHRHQHSGVRTRVVGLIWAQARHGVIGAEGVIPWHIPEDMAHFKEVTAGHTVIMGRRTWDSLPERFRPLPGRRNIVVTRNPDWHCAGAHPATSLPQALQETDPAEVWIVGGADIYRLALPYATDIWLTDVDADIPGDTYAPALPPDWHTSAASPWQESRTGLRFRIQHWHRGE